MLTVMFSVNGPDGANEVAAAAAAAAERAGTDNRTFHQHNLLVDLGSQNSVRAHRAINVTKKRGHVRAVVHVAPDHRAAADRARNRIKADLF
jgi:hypothetical protein